MKNCYLETTFTKDDWQEGEKVPLSLLCEGERGRLCSLEKIHPLAKRLADMGWDDGTVVLCVRYAPAKDPIAYRACGVTVALRRCDADKIFAYRCNALQLQPQQQRKLDDKRQQGQKMRTES